jgi:hypothetical protein
MLVRPPRTNIAIQAHTSHQSPDPWSRAIALAPLVATAVTSAKYWGDPHGLEGALIWK